MSILVKSLDVKQAKKELKKCPQIVQDYVNSLHNINEMNKQTIASAIKKIKEAER